MKKRINKIIAVLLSVFLCSSLEANVFESGSASNIYVDAEFLYWKAHQDGMPFAAGGFATTVEGNIQEVDSGFDPGFRIGAGLLLGCDPWDLSLTYTWYRTHATSSYFDPTLNSVGVFSGLSLLESANADWRLRFQTLDLAVSKNYCYYNRFVFAPVFAIRGAYIKETFISNEFPADGGIFPGVNSNHLQKFWAIGPQIGFNTAWNFCNNFSLIAEANFSLLWGDYTVRRQDNTVEGLGVIDVNTENRFNALRFVPQYRIGIQWDQSIHNDNYHVNVLVAWEAQQWINYNQMFYAPMAVDLLVLQRNANLNLYGLTLRTQFLF